MEPIDAAVPLLTDEPARAEASAVFDDIRASGNTDYIDDVWRALASDAKQLKPTWKQVKAVMGCGAIDPLTKERVDVAVSAANNCGCGLHTHAASARAKGITPEMGPFAQGASSRASRSRAQPESTQPAVASARRLLQPPQHRFALGMTRALDLRERRCHELLRVRIGADHRLRAGQP